MSSFQSRAPHCIESLCPFSCLWSVTVSQSSLVFHDLDWRSWGVLARDPIEYLPTWVCLVFFSYLNWDDGVWEGLPWKWSTHPPPASQTLSRGAQDINMTHHCWHWPSSLSQGGVCSAALFWRYYFPASYPALWKQVLNLAHPEGN